MPVYPQSPKLDSFVLEWITERRWKRWFWIAVGVLFALYIAYLVRDIWLPLAIAFLIAMVLDPVVDKLEARGWSRSWGTALIYFCFLLVLAAGLVLLVPSMIHQGEAISQQVDKYVPDRSPHGIEQALAKTDLAPSVKSMIVSGVQQLQRTVAQSGQWISHNLVQVASNLIWIVIIPIVAFYALKDFHLILAKLLLLVPKPRRELVSTLVAEVSVIFAKYMRGLLTVSILNGVATFLLLLCLRVPNALLLGGVAGLLYSVPYLGAIITVVIIAGVSFVSGGLQFMLLVVGANIVLHQVVFDQIISPRILGGHVGLHPILSIIALLIGNALLGIVGMILAVPVAASIQIAVVAMVPKLRHEIDLTSNVQEPLDKLETAQDESQSEGKISATEELHKSVADAVEQIEAQDAGKSEEELANEVAQENISPPDRIVGM